MNNKISQSLRMVRKMRSNFFSRCTNSYIRKKVTSKCPPDASAGRSMVEMLGVLAIIGVLSVGAIAGYSKAMTKYKLNKQAVTSILFIVISYIIFQSLSNSVYIFDRKFPMAE